MIHSIEPTVGGGGYAQRQAPEQTEPECQVDLSNRLSLGAREACQAQL